MNITTEADAWAEEVGRHSAIVLPSQGEKKENVYCETKKTKTKAISVVSYSCRYTVYHSVFKPTGLP